MKEVWDDEIDEEEKEGKRQTIDEDEDGVVAKNVTRQKQSE